MQRLKDRIALVTGSGAGIGRAVAKLFAEEGAHVYITDVDGEAVAKAAAEHSAKGHSVTGMTVDVSRGQDVTALMRTIEQQHRRLDVVVNNAGINVRTDFRNMSDADWVRLREVNLDGIIRIARDAFPLLKASGRASLIQHGLDHGASRHAHARRLRSDQRRHLGADARARGRVRRLQYPRQRAGAGLHRDGADRARLADPGVLRRAARADAA